MQNEKSREFTYSFPAIRGIQAGREYYVTMCPLNLVPKLFHFNDEHVTAELRAQRAINKSRIPKITEYLVKNPRNYVFSSLTASIDGEITFDPFEGDDAAKNLGTLTIPMRTRFVINDGQHRRAAIEKALEQQPLIVHDTISVVIFVDAGLQKSQQMFADLNRYAVRPTRSLGVLYDHRHPLARLVSRVVKKVSVFAEMTEMARSTISNRSRKLFTLSSIYHATKYLLKNSERMGAAEEALICDFWEEVAKNIPVWRDAVEMKVAPSDLRRDCVHAHGVGLQAIAIAGGSLIAIEPRHWKKRLAKIRSIDWSRKNAELWEGRALIGGVLSKAQNNVILTANVIKRALGLSMEPNEMRVEQEYIKGKNRGLTKSDVNR